jgi:hypothetical protein
LFAVWTSYGQDGTEEGVFGRFVSEGAEPIGPEFQVNTFAASRQFQPTVASSSERMAAVVWASFVGGATSFDLLAQRFGPAALTPPGPIVSALSPSALSISWRAVDSPEIVGIELHLDSRADPVLTSANPWTLGQLAPGSSHTFRMAYRFADGSRSALSEPATGKTWSSDDNFDGLPDDWQAMYWGNNPAAWANRDADSDGDGATNAEEFLAGTDPRNANSVLRTSITETEQGRFLAWNTQPGLVYQVQATGELREEWQDVGSPRFAVDSTDSVLLGGGDATVFYRVKRLR